MPLKAREDHEYTMSEIVDPMHMRHIKGFLLPARVTWTKVCAGVQEGRAIAHIRNPNDYDEIATGSLATEIDFLETPRETPPLFVSLYTEKTPYEALANELRNSLDRFDLPHRIEPVPSRGSWVANTGLKAEAILRCWQESESPICWIDADAEILRVPYIVFDNPFDFAIVRRQGWYDISSFVYFGKSNATGRLINCWANLCRENPDIWDQVLLTLAWYRVAGCKSLSSLWLHDGIFNWPRPWIRDWRDQVFYYPFKRKVRPSVAQKQASRDLKSFIDASKERGDELGSDDVRLGFRDALRHYDFTFDARRETILRATESSAK